LFQLFHIGKDLKARTASMRKTTSELEHEQANQASTSKSLSDKKSAQAKEHKQIVRKTREIKALQQTISDMNPALISLREQIEHAQKKIAKREERLRKFRADETKHNEAVRKLQADLDQVIAAEDEFEAAHAMASSTTATTLAGEQLAEYNALYVWPRRQSTPRPSVALMFGGVCVMTGSKPLLVKAVHNEASWTR
jgi:predicted  nucleic acid-binding Zn-ribbon protein